MIKMDRYEILTEVLEELEWAFDRAELQVRYGRCSDEELAALAELRSHVHAMVVFAFERGYGRSATTIPASSSEGIFIPGWHCASCGVFNGEVKERRDACRTCFGAKPS
jgi:hypothetical protein